MDEVAKRLAPKPDTLRELFLKSGNLCAFPGCGALMMNADGVFIAQLCHIEAAEEGGERFNPDMSNEDRRAANNLILMCYPHHRVTNDVVKYPVEKLRLMKLDHEKRFSHPDRAILETLKDWTELENLRTVVNLGRLNKVLGWNQANGELTGAVKELNEHIEEFKNVPIEVRHFLGAVAMRAFKMKDTRAVSEVRRGVNILLSDLKGAFQLSEKVVAIRANELDAYGLGYIDEMETDLGRMPALRLPTLESGWCFWFDLAEFCTKAAEPIKAFSDDLDFQRLDEQLVPDLSKP